MSTTTANLEHYNGYAQHHHQQHTPDEEMAADRVVDRIEVRAYQVPTEEPESDGTFEWNATTCVVVRVGSRGTTGMGYTYSHPTTATLVEKELAAVVSGCDAMSPIQAWTLMLRAVRNLGRQGLAAHAISAMDTALWDLKARILNVPLCDLWGRVRTRVPVYGSGGFTSYDREQLRDQLAGWVRAGMTRVKIKVGRHPEQDLERLATARDTIGNDVELFVDANGAYDRKQALYFATAFREYGVSWFEEPVTSDDLEGLRLLRSRAPAGMDITAGEYGYHPDYFRTMLGAEAVDVIQPDASRCLGYTGMLKAAALCEAWHVPVSGHCCPALHAHIGLALAPLVHVEYFHDHVRVEEQLFNGIPPLEDGHLVPDRTRPGHGMALNERRAAAFRARALP